VSIREAIRNANPSAKPMFIALSEDLLYASAILRLASTTTKSATPPKNSAYAPMRRTFSNPAKYVKQASAESTKM
jgi:hypothetical protein